MDIWRRSAAVLACVLLGVGAALVAGTPAQARPVEGSLSISGDADDYVSGGQSYAYSSAAGDRIDLFGNLAEYYVELRAANGDTWYVNFDAPTGETLAPGTYQDTNDPEGARLSVTRPWYDCAELTGSFTITNLVAGPGNYLQTLDVVFEQHCDGATAALRGEFQVRNPPPPPPLELGVRLTARGTVGLDGRATVSGTVTCNRPVMFWVSGYVRQAAGESSGITEDVTCVPGAEVPWRFTADPYGFRFRPGPAEVRVNASGYDEPYDESVVVETSGKVRLTRARA